MYIPRHNEEIRIPVMHQLIRTEPLAVLVTLCSSGLLASHIPMSLQGDGSEPGILRGHVSRANPQWRDLDASIEALAIFSGPQHYITPSWYSAKLDDGKVVPTWNYVVVHAYGNLKVVQDETWLLNHLEQLTTENEAGTPAPWKVTDAPAEFIRSQMKGIVGIEIPIRRLEGKWKVSQNRTEADKQRVMAGLGDLNTSASIAMRDIVEGRS